MTSSEIHGFLDLNDKVPIKDDEREVQRVSGRMVLTSLLKFGDNSSLIAEVHQSEPNGVTVLVYPNTPEAEALIINLVKNPATFLENYLPEIGVESGFIKAVIDRFLDPALVHEAANCKWSSETSTLLTPEEIEAEEEGEKLEQQSWYFDVVKQMEELTQNNGGRRAKNYASAAALYDLDGERWIKMMHEKNDGVINLDEMEEPEEGADGHKGGDTGEDVSTLGEEDALDGGESKNDGESKVRLQRGGRKHGLLPNSSRVTHPQVVQFGSRTTLVAVLELGQMTPAQLRV